MEEFKAQQPVTPVTLVTGAAGFIGFHVAHVLETIPAPDPSWSGDSPAPGTSAVPYRVYNIGNDKPVELLRCISLLESALGRKAEKCFLPMQAGDLPATAAGVFDLQKAIGFHPSTPLALGIRNFVEWYREFYGVPGPRTAARTKKD